MSIFKGNFGVLLLGDAVHVGFYDDLVERPAGGEAAVDGQDRMGS